MRRLAVLLLSAFLFASTVKGAVAAEAARPVYRRVATEERIVALTFDDGPHPRYTHAILDLLKEYDAKATFFMIGKNVELYGDVARRVVAEGHEIGNHTYAHPTLATLPSGALEREILEAEALIEECTGRSTALFRPPEGYCTLAVEDVVVRNGGTVILWSIDTEDWRGRPSDEIVHTVMQSVVPGAIILFHDYVAQKSTTVEALKEILPRLCAAGYRFVTISELIEHS